MGWQKREKVESAWRLLSLKPLMLVSLSLSAQLIDLILFAEIRLLISIASQQLQCSRRRSNPISSTTWNDLNESISSPNGLELLLLSLFYVASFLSQCMWSLVLIFACICLPACSFILPHLFDFFSLFSLAFLSSLPRSFHRCPSIHLVCSLRLCLYCEV